VFTHSVLWTGGLYDKQMADEFVGFCTE